MFLLAANVPERFRPSLSTGKWIRERPEVCSHTQRVLHPPQRARFVALRRHWNTSPILQICRSRFPPSPLLFLDPRISHLVAPRMSRYNTSLETRSFYSRTGAGYIFSPPKKMTAAIKFGT